MKNKFVLMALVISGLIPGPRPASASSESLPEVLETDSRPSMVCPFTVINGPKSIGNVVVAVFTDIACGTAAIGNAAWGGHGGTPTLTNGTHRLSNDALAGVGLTALTTSQSIQVQIQDPGNTTSATVCMQTAVAMGAFTCSGGPYTLDINNL